MKINISCLRIGFAWLVLVFLILYAGEIRSQNIPVFPDKPAVAAKPVVSKVKHHNVVHSGLKVRERAENSAFYFFDSFTNNENDWATNSDSTKMMGVVNGKFRIEGKSNRGFQSVRNFELDLTKDFSCIMVVKWIDGVQNSGFGVRFCSDFLKRSFNDFGISANGSYVISSKEGGGEWKNIKPWTPSVFINKGLIPNILSIKKEGNYISFYINDHEVEKFPFDGGYGLAFGFQADNKQTIDFDDFRLTGTKK